MKIKIYADAQSPGDSIAFTEDGKFTAMFGQEYLMWKRLLSYGTPYFLNGEGMETFKGDFLFELDVIE